MACTEIYKEHIMYTFHGFCKVVIRNAAITAWRDQQRRHKREISFEYLTEEKFYPLGTTDEYFTVPYEESGNHFPLLFRELQTVGNRENVRTLPEYNWVSNPQNAETSAERNGGAFTWGIRILSLMKRLCGRPAESRKR